MSANHQQSQKTSYSLLIRCWTEMFQRKAQVLDHMNFSKVIFPEAVSVDRLLSVLDLEPGYLSPDCSIELRDAVLAFEKARLRKCGCADRNAISNYFLGVDVGIGNGCTNVVNGVLHAILKWQQTQSRKTRNTVAVASPHYSVYSAQIEAMGGRLGLELVQTSMADSFLPTFEAVSQLSTDTTMAMILTFPSNPAQTTYKGARREDLVKIVKWCKEREIFLIADNVYQELIFEERDGFPEIHSLSGDSDFLIKVYGFSKDTPFFSGYRVGYWIGDSRIADTYREYISATENSLGSVSMSLFLTALLLRTSALEDRTINELDCSHFNRGILGWGRTQSAARILQGFGQHAFEERFQSSIAHANSIQRQAIDRVKEYCRFSRAFEEISNDNIGNLAFVKLRDEFSFVNDSALFDYLLREVGVGVLPAGVFGCPPELCGTWFRITLIHDKIERIIEGLDRIDNGLTSGYRE